MPLTLYRNAASSGGTSPTDVNVVDTNRPSNPAFRFATEDGIIGGNINANGDYTSGIKVFEYVPAVETVVNQIAIKMSGAGGFSASEYGNLGAALTNGIDLVITSNGVTGSPVVNPIFDNFDWITLSNGQQSINLQGNDDVFQVFFDFDYLDGGGFKLNPALGDKITFNLNDNFSGLNNHIFAVYSGLEAGTAPSKPSDDSWQLNGGIELLQSSWVLPNIEPPINQVNFRYRAVGSGTWTTLNISPPELGTIVYDVDGGTEYEAQIQYENNLGVGLWSELKTATPTALSANAVVIWDDTGTDPTEPVSFITNSGTGGSAYDLTVKTNGAGSVTANTQNGLPVAQFDNATGLRTASTAPNFGNTGSMISLFRPFFFDGQNKYHYVSSNNQTAFFGNNSNTFADAGGTWIGNIPLDTSKVYAIVVTFNGTPAAQAGEVQPRTNQSLLRVWNITDNVINDAYDDSGANQIAPEVLASRFGWNSADFFSMFHMSTTFYDGVLGFAEIESVVNGLVAKFDL